MLICSMPERRNRGPASTLQVMCVVFSLANTDLSNCEWVGLCTLGGKVHVGDREHPGAGISWIRNLGTSQISAAMNHLDLNGNNNIWQRLKAWAGLKLCSFSVGCNSSWKHKFAESDGLYFPLKSEPCIFSNCKYYIILKHMLIYEA